MKRIQQTIFILFLSFLALPSFAISAIEDQSGAVEDLISPEKLMDRMNHALSNYKVLSLRNCCTVKKLRGKSKMFWNFFCIIYVIW